MSSNEQQQHTILRAFEIDDRICIMIERDLSVALGQLILDTDTTNPALLAVGHQLKKMDRDHGNNK